MARFWFAAALFFALCPAKAGPSVCGAISYIGDKMPGALDMPASLSEAGKSYPIQVKSAVTEGYSRNMLCFQYQLLNAGTETIPLAFWSLVDDYRANDLKANESRFRNRTRPTSFDDPVKAPTQIKGLRSAETSSIAWRTVEDAKKSKEADASLQPAFSFAKASSLDAVVANAVKTGFLPDDEIAILDLKSTQGKVSPVSDTIGLNSGWVYSNSAIDFNQKLSYTFFKVSMDPKLTEGGQVRIFSPLLSALVKEPKDTSQFLEGISLYTKEPIPILTTSKSTGMDLPPSHYKSEPTFYVVEHPLTIEWMARDEKGGLKPSVQCIRIASYSPFPVSLNDKFCVR